MNICVVSGTFHPEPGGPPTYLYHLLPELVRRGHLVEVVTYGDQSSAVSRQPSVASQQSLPYLITRVSRRQPIPLRLARMTWEVALAGRSADVLFVSDYGLPAMLANILLRKPIVLKNVGDFAWEFCTRRGWIPPGQTIDGFQTGHHSGRVRALRAVQAVYARAATRVIAPSRYSAGLVTGWGVDPGRVRVIYNALDHAPFANLPAREAARRALGLGAGPLIVTVARLAPWKNVEALIRVLPLAQSRAPGAQLLIVGDGPMRAELEALARRLPAGGVTFAGAQPAERVRLYLRAADVFALYSRYEGLPHVLLEAMAAGTPALVSPAGGNAEVIEHGRNGLIVPLDDDRALADAVVALLTDRRLAGALAASAQASLERFSWERMLAETEAVLREVAA